MSRRNRYRRGKLLQWLVILLFAAVLILVDFKAQHIMGKMKYVNSGLEYYKEKQWIEAEKSLQRAADYRWFHYKEEKASSTLKALNWITEYKEEIASLYQQITDSSNNKDLDTFANYVSEYETSGFQNLTELQKEYLLERYPITQVVFSGWTDFKASLVNELNNPLHSNYNWAKEKIFLIPSQYFTQDKEDAILELFKTCDQKLYEKYAIATGIEPFRDLIDMLSDIYVNNRKYNLDTEWLTPQVKIFMYETLMQKSKEEIETFAQYVKAYRAGADRAYKDEAIEEIVEAFMEEKEKEIERLLKAKEYDELIKLYKDLKYFKDYTKEIEIAEKMQKYDHPEMLLEKPIEQYAFVLTGEDCFEANKYLIAIEKYNNRLELFLFIGEAQAYEINRYEFNLNDLGIDVGQIQALDIEDYLIGIRLAGTNRAIRYPVIRLIDNRLEYLTEFEGDTVELIDGLKHLKVTNPTSEAVAYTYDYILGAEGYEKQEIAATTIALSDSNLQDYVGKTVRFNCYIPEEAHEGIANAYYYLDATYYSDSMAYVYREDSVAIDKGSYIITGEIVSMEPYYNMTLQLEELRPKIRIIEMQKE